MKLLLVNNSYPSKEFPNFSTYIKSIEQCIIQIGIEVDILTVKKRHNTRFFRLIYRLLFLFKCTFLKKLNKYNFIYINHPTFAFPLFFRLLFFKKNIILHWHGGDLLSQLMIDKLSRYFLCKFERIRHIVPSEYFSNILQIQQGIAKSKIMVSPSGGVDTELFQPTVLEKSDTWTIGYASGLSKNKGADVIFELAKAFKGETILEKKVIFKLIEYGTDADFYKSRYDFEDLNIIKVTKMKKEEMPGFYNSIDLLIMPSFHSESLGLVVLEAMSCGKPVLAFNLFAMPEMIITKKTGERVDFKKDWNIPAWKKASIHIIKNSSSYSPRTHVKSYYNRNYVMSQYKEIFVNSI